MHAWGKMYVMCGNEGVPSMVIIAPLFNNWTTLKGGRECDGRELLPGMSISMQTSRRKSNWNLTDGSIELCTLPSQANPKNNDKVLFIQQAKQDTTVAPKTT